VRFYELGEHFDPRDQWLTCEPVEQHTIVQRLASPPSRCSRLGGEVLVTTNGNRRMSLGSLLLTLVCFTLSTVAQIAFKPGASSYA
jgi:hypothetical protein